MKKRGKKVKPKRKVGKWLYWTPRILAIIFILFLAMFSLDVFEGNYGFWGTILGLFMHNIPVLILLVLVIVSWKHELVGAITFILVGILYVLRLIIGNIIGGNSLNLGIVISWSLNIAGPAFLIGILFYLNYIRKNKEF